MPYLELSLFAVRAEAVVNATGEEFNPQYYVDYLKKKYSELYHIED